MSLKTDYKNFIPATQLKQYQLINNSDGTVSLRDVTTYTQEGDRFGAGDINATNTVVNQLTPLTFQNVTVETSQWAADSTSVNFPFRAAVPLTDVTENMVAEVNFSIASINDNNLASFAQTYSGGVYIYAGFQPTAAVTIDSVRCVVGVIA